MNSRKTNENQKNGELTQTDKIIEVFACSATKKKCKKLTYGCC